MAAIVFGGAGALGSHVVRKLKAAGFRTVGVDQTACADGDHSIVVDVHHSFEEQTRRIVAEAQKLVPGGKYDVIYSAVGGWTGGSIAAADLFASLDSMLRLNLESAFAASHAAVHLLKEKGMLVLTGSNAALSGTPGMVAYGASKAAVHQLVSSLASPESGLPAGAAVFGISPVTLDTPTNRRAMPSADFSAWTSCEEVADKVVAWAQGRNRPPIGSLLVPETKASVTRWYVVTLNINRREWASTAPVLLSQ